MLLHCYPFVGQAAYLAGTYPQVWMDLSLALPLAEQLRDRLPGLRLQINAGGGSFKSQLKKADRSGALHALVLGDDELARRVIACKPLRGQGEQQDLAWDELAERLAERLQ